MKWEAIINIVLPVKWGGTGLKLQVQILWEDNTVKEAEIELNADKFAPLSEEEKEAAVETIIRDYVNQHLAVRWELTE